MQVTAGKGDDVQFILRARPFGGAWNTKIRANAYQTSVECQRRAAILRVPEKTDVEITASAATGTVAVSGKFEFLLVEE